MERRGMGYGNARGFKARKRNGLGGLIGPPSVKAGKLVARPGTCVPGRCNLHIVAYRGASGNSVRKLVRARCDRIGPPAPCQQHTLRSRCCI